MHLYISWLSVLQGQGCSLIIDGSCQTLHFAFRSKIPHADNIQNIELQRFTDLILIEESNKNYIDDCQAKCIILLTT